MSDDGRMDLPRGRDVSGATATLPVFRTSTQRLCGALVTASFVASCVKQLPPAPPPEPVAPPLPAAAPPPEGHGRLIVDVVDGPVPVQRVHMRPSEVHRGNGLVTYRFTEASEVLCTATPCVADVPAGNVLLGFPVIGNQEPELELVHVAAETSVYRRALSLYQDNTGGLRVLGIIATALGGTSVLTGTVLLPIGLGEDHRGLTVAGGLTLGVGAAVLAFGIWAIRRDAPTFRPGAATHFALPGGRP
jgi:hypothetical protein